MPELQPSRREMETLHAKARAHDDYLAALRFVKSRKAALEQVGPYTAYREGFLDGYRDALEDLSFAIVKASRDRLAEAEIAGGMLRD